MTYFMIRHKASGEFMPQGKRDRGYSHWNPSTEHEFKKALSVPRLIISKKSAKKVIAMWAVMPNSRQHGYEDWDGEWTDDIISKHDERTKDDLEIVKVSIKEIKK